MTAAEEAGRKILSDTIIEAAWELDPDDDTTALERLEAIIQTAIDAELQAVVDKLPKYADTGKPIAPEMIVWLVQNGRASERRVRDVGPVLVGVVEDGPSGTCRGLAHYASRRCYSSVEAARAVAEALAQGAEKEPT